MSRPDRPQEIRKPTVLANFRPSVTARHALKAPSDWRKHRPGMSEAHLALIRKLPCTMCEAISRRDPHHLKSGPARKERGFGIRSTDRWAVPVCRFHHDEVERGGTRGEAAYFAKSRLDPYELANALWLNTGNLAAMGRVLIEHKQAAIRALKEDLISHGLTPREAQEQVSAGPQP